MSDLVIYKVAIVILLTVSGASLGGTTYYFQQRTNDLNNHVTNLTEELSSSNSQLSNLSNQVTTLNNQISNLNSQISSLQSVNSQLQSQIASLQSQLATLTKASQSPTTVISNGDVSYNTNGGLQPPGYVNFTVPSNALGASLNVSFTIGYDINGGVIPTRATLLSQPQYNLYARCNCFYFGNTTLPTTWVSPWISGGCNCYSAEASGLYSGIWILVFQITPSAAGSNLLGS